MAVIEHWQPSAGMSEAHRSLLQIAHASLEQKDFGLTQDEIDVLRAAVHSDRAAWVKFAENETPETIVAWIHVLTVAEREISGFETGKRSPVLVLISLLKQREAVPADLFQWIKANTTNRFLPYGDLLDRL